MCSSLSLIGTPLVPNYSVFIREVSFWWQGASHTIMVTARGEGVTQGKWLLGTCRWNGCLLQTFLVCQWVLNGIHVPIYTSNIVSPVSTCLCDVHPWICPIVDKFYIQCSFLYLCNCVGQCFSHLVFGWVLIFFKFWYLDGYDFKALRGTPLYKFVCRWPSRGLLTPRTCVLFRSIFSRVL